MKAKKKPLDEKTAADYGVDVTPRLTVVKTSEPAERAAGEMVGSVDELVAKLKEKGAVRWLFFFLPKSTMVNCRWTRPQRRSPRPRPWAT
jgi:electron transfer flavoprotein beta subunit